MTFSWIDIAIVVVIALSVLISVYRGFTREAVSLGAWIGALWLAATFSGALAQWLPESLDAADIQLGETTLALKNMRVGISFVVLVLLALIAGAVVNYAIGRFLLRGTLHLADRLLGLFFGGVRGVIIVVVLVMAAGLTRFPETPWWNDSRLVGPFQQGAVWVIGLLPRDYAAYFSFP